MLQNQKNIIKQYQIAMLKERYKVAVIPSLQKKSNTIIGLTNFSFEGLYFLKKKYKRSLVN